MTSAVKLKEAYEPESKHGAFYTGGNVEWHENVLYCQTAASVSLLNVDDGTVAQTIGEENTDDADFIHTFTTDGQRLVSSHKSGLLKLWNREGQLLKMWKYIHKGPIASLLLNQSVLASGGADSSIRIWNLDHQSCTLHLRGCQGVVNVLEIHADKNILMGSGDDGRILSFDLNTGKALIEYNGHFSKVTSLKFKNHNFISAGRDKVIILWQIGQAKALKTIAIYEVVESLIILPDKFKVDNVKNDPDHIYVGTAGENGAVRIWDVTQAKQIYQQKNSLVNKGAEPGSLSITKLLIQDKTIAVISADHNIILHSLKSFVCLKQFIGFSDEILDIVYVGKSAEHLAVATNSPDIKFYDATMNCQLLKGHSDIVLALSVSKSNPDLMLSAGKDNKIKLWRFDGTTMNAIGVGVRHAGSVAAVAFSNTAQSPFFVSGSQDLCLKLWPIEKTEEEILNCSKTEQAHTKDINSVAVSPNDKIIASASQDKTVKLWTSDTLTFVGTLRGHKRGVWCVRFSPIDQVVLTTSADCTIKLWSVSELNCLKTLEGHESSVLCADFLSNGMQILTAGSDGLLKLFSVKTNDCVGTFEEHAGRIWSMAIKKDDSQLVTGGADSVLIKWKDVSEERRLKRIDEMEKETLEMQQLANYMQSEQLLKALKLALKWNRPQQVLKIIEGVIKKGGETANGLNEIVGELRNDQKEALLKCASNWNMNSRNCQAAQLVLNVLINEMQNGDFRPVGFSGILEGTLPYTERHFKRLTQMLQGLYLVNYTIDCMQPHVKSLCT